MIWIAAASVNIVPSSTVILPERNRVRPGKLELGVFRFGKLGKPVEVVFPTGVPDPLPRPPPPPAPPPPLPLPPCCANTLVERQSSAEQRATWKDFMAGHPVAYSIGPLSVFFLKLLSQTLNV